MSDAVEFLGARLKEVRTAANLSLREVARQLNVSPSFVSQIENGKSQPSVGTLYQLAQLLKVPVDSLFGQNGASNGSNAEAEALTIRDHLANPSEIWTDAQASISVVSAKNRSKIEMDTGVEWHRLAATADRNANFMEITYPAGSASNATGDFLVHEGYEYGYALEGEIELTIGDVVITLVPGQSIGFDSSIPHMLRNPGNVDFRGIWFVHGCPQHGKPQKNGNKSARNH